MRIIIVLSFMLLFITIFVSCRKLIYDDKQYCLQEINIDFHTKSLCQSEPAYLDEVTNLYLLAFDIDGLLVKSLMYKNINPSKDYSALLQLKSGAYSFIGWTGLDDSFDILPFKDGVTAKTDVLLSLQQDSYLLKTLASKRVYQGESPIIHLLRQTKGATSSRTSINLKELTNRIKVEIELHESLKGLVNIEDFEVLISAENGTLNIDGSMPVNSKPIQYPFTSLFQDGNLVANFGLLDLKMGYKNRIVLKNTRRDEVMFSGDLIASILLKNENINLDCENDFSIKFIIKDKCLDCNSYMCSEIFVNNWSVYSYDAKVGVEY